MIIIKRLIGIIIIVMWFLIPKLHAQPGDLVLNNMTVTTTETYNAANSITAGPNFTISGTGDVTFGSPDVNLIGEFVIESGGQFTVYNDVIDGIETHNDPALPTKFFLEQNYPNPFNPTTHIRYSLPSAEHVKVVIYNASGQVIKVLISQNQNPGYHSVVWDGTIKTGERVSSGVYYYKVTAGRHNAVAKMTLLK